MRERVRYPRALAVVRVALYLVATVMALSLTGVAVASLVLVVGIGGVALLLNGDVSLLAMAGLFGLVVATFALLGGGLVAGVRRVDDAVREAARVPTPVERLKQQYVDAELDETEFERRLVVLLDDVEGAEDVGGSVEDVGGSVEDVGVGDSLRDDVDEAVRVPLVRADGDKRVK